MKVRMSWSVSLFMSILLLAWTPALAQEDDPDDPIGVFFSGGTGEGYRYTDPSGKDLGCLFGDSFSIDIDVYYLGVLQSKNVYLSVEAGDGSTEASYEGNTVSGVTFNPSSPVNVPNAWQLPSNWDPTDPHADVTVTIPLTGLSGTYYYRVHAQDGGAANLYFSFEADCVSDVPEFGDLSIAASLGAISTVSVLVLLRRRLGIPSRL